MGLFTRILPVVAAGIGAAVALAVVAATGRESLPPRVPGLDRSGAPKADAAVALNGTFEKGDGEPSTGLGEWPQFRGTNRTGVIDQAGLKKDLSAIKTLWEIDAGDGYAGVTIARGRAYLLDYNPDARADVIRCLSMKDGKDIWRRSYNVYVARNHGMSRTVPAVGEKGVVTLGPKCHLVCVNPDTGEFLWGKDLVKEYGTKVPLWYAGQCPLIDPEAEKGDGRPETVIVAPSGEKALMLAIDVATGNVVWTTPNPMKWEMTHASVTPVTIDGVRQFIYCGSGGVAGVEAATGKILWTTEDWVIQQATVPSPVDMGNGRILFSGGYEAGALVMDIQRTDGVWTTRVVRRLADNEFSAEQQTPVFFGGSAYGVRTDGQIVCLSREGEIKWVAPPGHFVGAGPYFIADGSFYGLSDAGILYCVEARPDRFVLQGKGHAIKKGRECWGPMAVADGKLVARDLKRIVCLDLRQ